MKNRFNKKTHLAFTKTSGLILSTLLLTACGSSDNKSANTDTTPTPNAGSGNGIKNIIMMIGDGMGPQQVGLLEDYIQLTQEKAAH